MEWVHSLTHLVNLLVHLVFASLAGSAGSYLLIHLIPSLVHLVILLVHLVHLIVRLIHLNEHVNQVN